MARNHKIGICASIWESWLFGRRTGDLVEIQRLCSYLLVFLQNKHGYFVKIEMAITSTVRGMATICTPLESDYKIGFFTTESNQVYRLILSKSNGPELHQCCLQKPTFWNAQLRLISKQGNAQVPETLEYIDLKQAFQNDYLTLTNDWGDDTTERNPGLEFSFTGIKIMNGTEAEAVIDELFKCMKDEECTVCTGLMEIQY